MKAGTLREFSPKKRGEQAPEQVGHLAEERGGARDARLHHG